MDNTELLPCPFCGSIDLKLYATHASGHGCRRGKVRCMLCGCELYAMGNRSIADLPSDMPTQERYETLQREAKEAVVKKWNRRA